MAPALEPQRRQHLGSSFPLLAVVATLAVLAHGLQPAQGCAANGTNKAIQEMMTARCLFWQYDEAQVHPSDFSPRNCTLAWERFYSAFRFKAAAATTMADYGPFATYMSFRAPENRSLFWTGWRTSGGVAPTVASAQTADTDPPTSLSHSRRALQGRASTRTRTTLCIRFRRSRTAPL